MNPDIVCASIAKFIIGKPEIQMYQNDIDKVTEWAGRVYDWKVEHNDRKGDIGLKDIFVKRETSGRLGEMGLERFLDVEFCDWSIGSEKDNSKPDLNPIKIRCGVKSSSILVKNPNVPLVKIYPSYPEIIVVLRPNLYHYEFGDLVSICGFATKEVMMRNSHMNLIRSKSIRDKGWKTGFHGFEHLLPFSNLKELKELVGQTRTNTTRPLRSSVDMLCS
jgi:hypothetical protein